jgi:hypothetical protein
MGSDDFDSGWDEIGIVSSSVARATADAVRADLDALNMEITQIWYPKVASQRRTDHGLFVNSWIRFRDETYKMLDDSKRTLNPELASSIVKRLNLTQENLKDWRARFEKISGEKSQTTVTKITPPEKDKDPGSSPWMYVAIGLGSVVLVGGGLIYLLAPVLVGRGAMAKAGV